MHDCLGLLLGGSLVLVEVFVDVSSAHDDKIVGQVHPTTRHLCNCSSRVHPRTVGRQHRTAWCGRVQVSGLPDPETW